MMTRLNKEDTPGSPEGGGVPCIMDSSALIAYLEGRPKGKIVQRIMEQTLNSGGLVRITAFDMLLVYAYGVKDHMSSFPELLALLEQLPLRIENVTKQMAFDASKLLTEHKSLGPRMAISLGLAKTLEGLFITAEPNFDREGLLSPPKVIYVGEET